MRCEGLLFVWCLRPISYWLDPWGLPCIQLRARASRAQSGACLSTITAEQSVPNGLAIRSSPARRPRGLWCGSARAGHQAERLPSMQAVAPLPATDGCKPSGPASPIGAVSFDVLDKANLVITEKLGEGTSARVYKGTCVIRAGR